MGEMGLVVQSRPARRAIRLSCMTVRKSRWSPSAKPSNGSNVAVFTPASSARVCAKRGLAGVSVYTGVADLLHVPRGQFQVVRFHPGLRQQVDLGVRAANAGRDEVVGVERGEHPDATGGRRLRWRRRAGPGCEPQPASATATAQLSPANRPIMRTVFIGDGTRCQLRRGSAPGV